MTMLTQILAKGAQHLNTLLVDSVQLLDVGDPVTVGPRVTRSLTPVGQPLAGLVQTTVLDNAVESEISSSYSIKLPVGTAVRPGQAVRVLTCTADPDLVGVVLLLGKVSQNGMAMLRKAVATRFEAVDQQGKGGLK